MVSNQRQSEANIKKKVEGFKKIQRYIIIDDFTETGTTLKDIMQKVSTLNPRNRCAGAFFYRNANTLNDAMICQGLKIKHWNKRSTNDGNMD